MKIEQVTCIPLSPPAIASKFASPPPFYWFFLPEFLRSLQRLFRTWSTYTIKQQPLPLSPFHRLYPRYARFWEAEVHASLVSLDGCCHRPISGWYPSLSYTGWVVPRWGLCPHHTNVSVQFQPWNCWGLWWKIDLGPLLFTLLQPERPKDGVISGMCDEPSWARYMAWAFTSWAVFVELGSQ
jgi:hypothetical protein